MLLAQLFHRRRRPPDSKLVERYFSVAVAIDDIQLLLYLRLSHRSLQLPHQACELLPVDGARAVCVRRRKVLAQLILLKLDAKPIHPREQVRVAARRTVVLRLPLRLRLRLLRTLRIIVARPGCLPLDELSQRQQPILRHPATHLLRRRAAGQG